MNERKMIKVWDPLIRIFHWSLAGAFSIAWMTAEGDFGGLHTWMGYTILGLVALRLVWGVIGSKHARFTSFVKGPEAALGYLKGLFTGKAKSYEGHNPAAGLMVVALLVSLTFTGVAGMALYGVEEHAGPLAAWMAPYGDRMADFLEEVHELLAGLTLTLVVFHVLGVLASSLAHGENLIRAMVTGHKEMGAHGAAKQAHSDAGGGMPSFPAVIRKEA